MEHSAPQGAKGTLIPARNIKKTSKKEQETVRDENASVSAKTKIGVEEAAVLRNRWSNLDTGNGGED